MNVLKGVERLSSAPVLLHQCKSHQHLTSAASVKFSTSRVRLQEQKNEDFLHHSLLPTDYFQPSLPRLAIPKLEETCRRYLAAQHPLLNDEEYKQTESVVNKFKENEGPALHEELVTKDKQEKHTSYISEPWFNMYLMDRRPVVLNHNPFMAFKDDEKPGYNDQLVRATNFVVSSMKFVKTLRENILEPEVFHLNPAKTDNPGFRKVMRWVPRSLAFYASAGIYKAFPLDMSQYGRLFNSTRIPRKGKDELHTNPSAKHLLVMRKGNIYSVDVLDNDGNVREPTEIMASLKYILTDSRPPAEFPLGVMTSQNRDVWADVRDKIVAAGNVSQLREIDEAAFALCLDDLVVDDEDAATLSRNFLHGDGANRWYDKSFSLLMTKDGRASVNFEHAWGDGVAVLRYFNESFKHTTEHPTVHPDTAPAAVDPADSVRLIEFNFTEEIKQDINAAQESFNKAINSLDMDFAKVEHVTKKDIKKFKLSPDSFLQLAIQMGYYRQYGRTVATYESCSTAAFRHGRTETIRPATKATKTACELFERRGNLPSLNELQDSIRECSKVHGQLTKEAAMGQGFDRHLFGMRLLAEKKGGQLPELYRDPAYARINHNILSTSTMSSPAILLGGFAPVVPDGYGVGYGVEDTYLGCNVTSYPPATNVSGFVQCISSSIEDMASIMSGTDFRK